MNLSEKTALKTASELHVYDFDDTLFDSPLVPKDWPETARDWWLSPDSLKPPYVPEGQESKFKLPAADAAKRSIASGAHTVLVTGRMDVPGMREQLSKLLRALGLQMDGIYLKDSIGPTAAFKQKAVFALLGNMPNAKKVAMWDDMADNLKAVGLAAAEKGVAYESNVVKSKHQIEQRLPTFEEQLEALERRLRLGENSR